MPPLRCLTRMIALTCAAATSIAMAQSPADWPEYRQLVDTRDMLRQTLRQKAAGDAERQPLDVRMVFSQGLGRGPLTLDLRRQNDRWLVRGATPLPETVGREQIDVSGLTWTEDGWIRGPVVIRLDPQEADESDAAEGEDAAQEAADRQTFAINVQVQKAEPRLVLTFLRFQNGANWVLSYRPEGDKWVFDREIEAPSQLTGWGPFKRQYQDLAPDADGRFAARIDLEYAGTQPRHQEIYAPLQPVVTFEGRLIDGRVDSAWILKAPGGKHLLGSGKDKLSGGVRTAELAGRFRSTGARGGWLGEVQGLVIPVPKDPVAFLAAEDPAAAPATAAEATVRAARMYREIRAMALALRNYPMPLTDALAATIVPEPIWGESATEEAMRLYVQRLAHHAREVAKLKLPEVAVDAAAPEDATFGPFFGLSCLGSGETNTLAPVAEGPQQWRSLTGWQMIGPFEIVDQETPVLAPEVLAVDAARYERSQLFTTSEGEVRTIASPAGWTEAWQDGATVAPPRRSEHSAGSWRFFSWYGATQIDSAADQTVWLAVRMAGQGMIWLNDEVIWRSTADFERFQPAIVQAKLRKGVNRLLVRCATNRAMQKHAARLNWFDGYPQRPQGLVDFTTFAVFVCTRGRPGDGASASQALPPSGAAEGSRRDGSGIWPDAANPPLAWDLKSGANVAWTTPLPMGAAEPVVRGGKVFVTAEPDWLYCLDAATGKELWKRQVQPPASQTPPKGDAFASVSPVVTDDAVYVTFGTGAVARLGLDGTPAWTVDTGAAWSHPNMGDPLIADDLLVIQAHLGKEPQQQFALLAFRTKDGSKAWTATGPVQRVVGEHDRAAGLGNGMALMRLANGDLRKTLIITGDGAVVDATDGTLLHRDIFHVEATRTPPVVDGDVVYTTPVMGQEAARLWLDPQGRVGVRTLWHTPPNYGRGQAKTTTAFGVKHWMKAPVLKDGLLYVVRVDSAHVPQHHPCPWTELSIYDAATGRRLSRLRAILRDATDPTVRPAIAGRYLYVGDGGAPVGGFGGNTEHGQMAVLEILPRRDDLPSMTTPTHSGTFGLVVPLSKNQIDRTRCGPVFEGDRMYLRGFTGLTCLAADTDKGRDYQRRAAAASIVRDVVGQKPEALAVTAVQPADEAAVADQELTTLKPDAPARQYLVLGPVEKAQAADVAAAVNRLAAWPKAGETIKVGQAELTFRATTDQHLLASKEHDAIAALEGKRSGVAFFVLPLEVARQQRVVYRPTSLVTESWLNGTKIASGETVELALGHYLLMTQVEAGRVPPFVRQARLVPGFARAQPVFDSPQLWAQRVKVLQGHLEAIRRDLNGTSEAIRARLSLQGAGLLEP